MGKTIVKSHKSTIASRRDEGMKRSGNNVAPTRHGEPTKTWGGRKISMAGC